MKNIIKTLLVVVALVLVLVACELPFIPGGDNPNPILPPEGECKHVGGIATCQAKATCQICGETYGELGEHIVVNVPAVEPTCTKVGSTAASYCSLCDKPFVKAEEVPVVGHSMEFVGYEDIYEVYVCSSCGFTSKEDVKLPEVTVTDITDSTELTFALNFAIANFDSLSNDYLNALMAKYGSYYVDYVLTIGGLNVDEITFNANGDADGYLGGQYDVWSSDWVYVPFEEKTVKNGEELYIMQTAAEIMGKKGLRYTLEEVATVVQNFDCGIYFTEEFCKANPDMVITLKLVVFTEDANGVKTLVNGGALVEGTFTLK